MRYLMFVVTTAAVVSIIGCSGSGSDTSNDQTATNTSSQSASTPGKTVHTFLEAVRTGNAKGAMDNLTPLALEQINKYDMDISPPASETSKFSIGAVDVFEADKAFVDSVWIELDADGKPFSESITWGLRLIDGEWRISGMAADMGPNQPMEVIDFENPEQYAEIEPSAPAAQPGSVPQQAVQPSQDPFNQTLSR